MKGISKKLHIYSPLILLQGIILLCSMHPVVGMDIDSLRQSIGEHRANENKRALIVAYKALGEHYQSQFDNKLAVEQFELALSLAKDLENDPEVFHLNNEIGHTYFWLDNYRAALDYLIEANKVSKTAVAESDQSTNLSYIAEVYMSLGNYRQALFYQLEALDLSKGIADTLGIATAYHQIGNIYWYQKQYDRSLENYFKALGYFRSIDSPIRIWTLQAAISTTYTQQGQQEEALSAAKKSHRMALDIGYPYGIAFSTGMMGSVNLLMGNYEEAENQILQAIRGFKELNVTAEQAAFLDELAKINQARGEYDLAIDKLQESLKLYTQIDKRTDKVEILKSLSENYELKGDIETSHTYLKQYQEERDVLLAQSSDEQMKNLETLIEAQRKQQQLDKLQEQSRLARTRFYGYSLLFGLLVLILISWLLYARYRTQARANQMLTEKNAKIEEQNAKLLDANAELGQFAEIAAKDLTAPLGQLKEWVANSQADPKLTSTTAQLEDLVTGLSLYAVLSEPPEAQLVNMSEIVSEAIATLPANISHKNIKIRMQELPTLMVNRRQMVQLFQHLMSYTIRFKGQQDPEISIHWEAETQHYQFSFQDNSQSLSTKAQNIFALGKHLVTPKDVETVGVGLAISKKIIEQHGGNIWLSPTTEGGNTFVFTLPR